EAWDARDQKTLAAMVFPDLMIEWKRRLDDFAHKGWHNRVKVLTGPSIEYVGLVNREDDSEDRVCVRIEATLEDYVVTESGAELAHDGSQSRQTSLCEYWTLAWSGDHWV